MSQEPFEPPQVTWTPISARLTALRRAVTASAAVVEVVVVVVLGMLLTAWVLLALVPAIALAAWEWWLAGRQVRSWGYAERDDDLLVRHGILFRTLVVVPYGRLQYVDVQAGPLDRRFGVARVQLHTASAGTDAYIPGLAPTEAARLRDRLASRGEAQLAGL